MQFTPQQLTGGPKYQHKCKIGNWSEDLEIEEIKLKDYLKKKETGSLLVNAKQKQLEESLKQVELSSADDGLLHFGHTVMLLNHQSKAFMCANPYEMIPKDDESYVLNTGPNSNACVRNVFTIESADRAGSSEDGVLRYGQNFRLRLEPFAKISKPTYMHSGAVTNLAAAKFSRHQEVVAYAGRTGETLWQILWPDTQTRFEMEGEPVPAGSPCVFRHVHTGSFLASDEIPYHNIFGQEWEVHCHPYYSRNKTHNLASEKKGDITGDYALRRHGLANIWTVLTSDAFKAAEATGTASFKDTAATELPK